MTIRTSPLRVFPTLKRVQKLALLLQDFLSTRSHPVSVWRQLLGVMSSMSVLVPGARLRMRSLQICLNVSGPLLLKEALVTWDDCCHPDLLWWSDVSHLQAGLPLWEDLPDLFLYTDTSDPGWGASLGNAHLSGFWFPLCSSFSINHQELLAVLFAIRGFLLSLRGRVVAVFSNSTTALAYLKRQGGTRSSTLSAMAQTVLRLCKISHIHLLPQFIPGKLNVLADFLSRQSQIIGSEWTLCSEAFSQLLRQWLATVDLFVTALNHHLPVYFSPMVDPTVSGHQCHAPEFGWSPGVCLSSLRPHLTSLGEGPSVSGAGAHLGGSVLASAPLVPGPFGAFGGNSLFPATKEGSAQTAPLSSLSPEPPHASADCVAYLQQSACHAGFS